MAPGKFAFTIHPTDISFVHRRWPVTRHIPERLTERLISLKRPFKASDVHGIVTRHNTASGMLVAIPLTTRMWSTLPEEFLIRRVVEASQLAERRGPSAHAASASWPVTALTSR